MKKDLDLILLLGGTGSRLKVSGNDNKHLVDIGGKPMVEHTKDKIDQFEKEHKPFANKYVITNGLGLDRIMPILGEGYNYIYQSKPNGLLDAAYLANPSNDFLLYLGDQFFEAPLTDFIKDGRFPQADYRVWLKASDKAKFHNTAILNGYDGWIKKFIEKPQNLSQGYVATGIYMFPKDVFEYLPHLQRNDKGETDLADLLNRVLRDDKTVGFNTMQGGWSDVGTPERVKEARGIYNHEN